MYFDKVYSTPAYTYNGVVLILKRLRMRVRDLKLQYRF